MAAKRTVARKSSDQRRTLKTVRELTLRAQSELAKLLRRHKAGTVTPVELDTGLEELKGQLRQIAMHEFRL